MIKLNLTENSSAHLVDRLSATRERPLFSPSRRQPPPPARLQVLPPPPPRRRRERDSGRRGHGHSGQGYRPVAPQNEIRRVRIGDDVGGWKVAQIEGRRLVLSLDSRLAIFTMFGRPR